MSERQIWENLWGIFEKNFRERGKKKKNEEIEI